MLRLSTGYSSKRIIKREMDRIVVFENEKISVWCYPEKGIIHHQMHAVVYREPFREALSAGLDAMILHRATKWLSDDRANTALPPDDEEWATNTWFPQVRAAGWKYWAMVQPIKVVGQMNVARFVKMYSDLGITARIFTDPDEAFAWIDRPDGD
jgi:hypothetical protein